MQLAQPLMDTLTLRDNLFIVPNATNDKYIAYAPLQGFSFFCGENDVKELKEYLTTGQLPQNDVLASYISKLLKEPTETPFAGPEINCFDKLLIILSQRCNLNCSYCFAQNSRSNSIISIDHVKTSIEYILERNNGSQKTFTFIGGGEPLVTWDLLKESIQYIESRAKDLNVQYQIRIVTNATLLDENRIKWLNRGNIVISVSSDILPEIQNSQRPFHNAEKESFNYVDNALKLLHKYKMPHTLRATITELNVDRMDEMAVFSINNYPSIKRLHFEPVTDNSIDNNTFFKKFIDSYISTYSKCEQRGVYLTNSYISSY
jgi:sulfatase maturation enzyme AslB (radical SAM superfamily)